MSTDNKDLSLNESAGEKEKASETQQKKAEETSKEALQIAGRPMKRVEKEMGSVQHRFNAELKARFIEYAAKLWPNIGKICRAVGVTRQCYYYHLERDEDFRAAMIEAKEAKLDDLEQINVEEASTTGREAFLPRISTLKAYRRSVYDPAKVVRVEGLRMGDGEAVQRIGGLDKAVDAEIVKTYSERKQIKEAKQREQERLGGGDGGEQTGGRG